MHACFCLKSSDIRIMTPSRRNYCLCIMLNLTHHLVALESDYVATEVRSQVVHQVRESPALNCHSSATAHAQYDVALLDG